MNTYVQARTESENKRLLRLAVEQIQSDDERLDSTKGSGQHRSSAAGLEFDIPLLGHEGEALAENSLDELHVEPVVQTLPALVVDDLLQNRLEGRIVVPLARGLKARLREDEWVE